MMDGFQTNNSWMLQLQAVLIVFMVSAIQALYFKSPMFNRTPTNVTYHVGDTAILPCSVRNLGTKEVIWKRKKQKHVITVGDFVFISDNSYSIDHRDDSDDWNLIIKNVQKSHAGYFECQVSTRENMNITVQLNVIDPPPRRHYTVDKKHEFEDKQRLKKIPAVHISGPAFIDKGQPIVLTCNASGPITPDDIDWFKDGKKVRSSANEHIYIRSIRNAETKTLYSTLEIKHGEMTDSGTYICRSSDLEIESHNLMVLNASSDPKKRNNPDVPSKYNPTPKKEMRNLPNNGTPIVRTVNYTPIVLVLIVQICLAVPFGITLPT